MLRMQELVYESTKKVHKIVAERKGKVEHADHVVAEGLGNGERDIVKEADMMLKLLEQDGTAVALPEVMQQARKDMAFVAARLAKHDAKWDDAVGNTTQEVEEDIIAALKNVIEALKKAQEDQENRRNPPPGDPPPPPPKDPNAKQELINKVNELKMLKIMQEMIYSRTRLWSKRFQGEQAKDPDIITALKELANRQMRTQQAADKIAKGRNN